MFKTSTFVTAVIAFSLSSAALAENKLMERIKEQVHTEIATLVIQAEEVLTNKKQSDFFNFFKDWSRTNHKINLKGKTKTPYLDELYKSYQNKALALGTITYGDLEELRLELFRYGLKNYCKDKALMTSYESDECGNCDAQTRLSLSFMDLIDEKLPGHLNFGVQFFTDHVRPVLLDKNKKVLLDFVSGKRESFDEVDTSVYHINSYYWLFMKAFKMQKGELKDFTLLKIGDQKIAGIALSHDGYLNSFHEGATFSSDDPPENATIDYQSMDLENTRPDEQRAIGSDEDDLSFGFEGESSIDHELRFKNGAILRALSEYENYPYGVMGESSSGSDFPIEIIDLPRKYRGMWSEVSKKNRHLRVPTAGIRIHDRALFNEWQKRNIIGKIKLIYSVYQKRMNRYYLDRDYKKFIALTENPLSVSEYSLNELKKMKELSAEFSHLLQFRDAFINRVLSRLSLNINLIWERSYVEKMIMDYTSARADAYYLMKGKSYLFIEVLKKAGHDKAMVYTEMLSLLRGEFDESFNSYFNDTDVPDFVVSILENLSKQKVELTKDFKIDLSKVVYVDLTQLRITDEQREEIERKKEERIRNQEQVSNEDSEGNSPFLKLPRSMYFSLFLSLPKAALQSPAVGKAFSKNLTKEDLDHLRTFIETYKYLDKVETLVDETYSMVLDGKNREKNNIGRVELINSSPAFYKFDFNGSSLEINDFYGFDMSTNLYRYKSIDYREHCSKSYWTIRDTRSSEIKTSNVFKDPLPTLKKGERDCSNRIKDYYFQI
ncbi:hypothetical protein HBN50_00780 [Halobacteriovorax sp. GB3]|uniref:hypothetical protein n=1 Tax=Halobacteriovorax sp. GB3 TaxID=2719615 RepID=UPI0023624093|nr:hypothetical protein [Halobacteriovorax sp. GB3]MDD0851601.1 hypothetical protein [Halobacteriovorax sp. GB3]